MPRIKRTGGRWDPREDVCYFLANSMETLQWAVGRAKHQLIAINEITGEKALGTLQGWIADGHHLLIDSGVFNLANEHARRNKVPLEQALALAPDEIDGFAELLQAYRRIVSALKDDCWGYIEIDQGGRDCKLRTRAMLEAEGLRPIPVYHPLNDGWDYFDELAQAYDRICVGNLVQAEPESRKRMLATIWERRRRYPDLWVHLLGYTPNALLNAFPVNSCDSSTWLSAVRWPDAFAVRAALRTVSRLDGRYAYDYELARDAPGGNGHAKQMGAYEAFFLTRTWRALLDEYRRHGGDPGLYLAPDPTPDAEVTPT